MLGLEMMVAAEVVRTVTLESTWANVLVLGALVLIRTFLSWGMSVEVEGCWPWQLRAHSVQRSLAATKSIVRECKK